MTALTDDTLAATPHAMRDEMIVFALMAVALAAVPFTGIYPFFVMQALCFALVACAFNLLIGYGGLLSFGHAMFLGTGGYAAAHLLKVGAIAFPVWPGAWITIPFPPFTPELALLGGTLASAVLAVITGYVSIRRQGIYFSMITLTYGLGVGLAALAGVLSAPINQVRPLMGADLIIVVFAVVVIGGMGSIMGSIITGFALGVIEGLTKYFYPEASNTVVFVLMVLVLLVKPTGLTGRAA